MRIRRATYLLISALILLLAAPDMAAQRFKVESCRVLPNDVSAFINSVRDLNGEDCGLLKVMASQDFVFSTPLGIVKRIDKTGEIWLYLPRGTKKITIKHPEWGVLRDYELPSRLDSHITYELRIDEPLRPVRAIVADTVVTTVRDTLVVTRIDTLVIKPQKQHIPFEFNAMVTAGYGGRSKTLTGGLMLVAMKRHGGFVHLSSDFGRIGKTIGECGRYGEIDGEKKFYSGETRHSAFMLNAGMAHRLSNRVAIFEGVGYGSNAIAWQLAPSEGGGYVKNSHYTISGVSFEAGAMLTFNRIKIEASVVSIRGKEWYGTVGIGIRLGK